MRHVRKPPEPVSLTVFRAAQPHATWEQMRDDAHHRGQQAYADIKSDLVQAQRGLCVYCESYISSGLTDDEVVGARSRQRVEHFHPKSDTTGIVNWALHWPILWAVCLGGSQKPPEGEPFDPAEYLPPLPDNLSCDSYKDHQIRAGQLAPNPEGWILAPYEVPTFPRLFRYAPDGTPEADPDGCAGHVVPGNRHPDTATLVSETVKHLNLGCDRLNRNRQIARGRLEKEIGRLRRERPGANPSEVLLALARRLFSNDPTRRWIEYFTLIRWRLGDSAERHLRDIGFNG